MSEELQSLKVRVVSDVERAAAEFPENKTLFVYAPKAIHMAAVDLTGVPLKKKKEIRQYLKSRLEAISETPIVELSYLIHRSRAVVFGLDEKINRGRYVLPLPALVWWHYIRSGVEGLAVYVLFFEDLAAVCGLSSKGIESYRVVSADEVVDTVKSVSKFLKSKYPAKPLVGFTDAEEGTDFQKFDIEIVKSVPEEAFFKFQKTFPTKGLFLVLLSVAVFFSFINFVFHFAKTGWHLFKERSVRKEYLIIRDLNMKLESLPKTDSAFLKCLSFLEYDRSLPAVVRDFEATPERCRVRASFYAVSPFMEKEIETYLKEVGGHYERRRQDSFIVFEAEINQTREAVRAEAPHRPHFAPSGRNLPEPFEHLPRPPAQVDHRLREEVSKTLKAGEVKAASALAEVGHFLFGVRSAFAAEEEASKLESKDHQGRPRRTSQDRPSRSRDQQTVLSGSDDSKGRQRDSRANLDRGLKAEAESEKDHRRQEDSSSQERKETASRVRVLSKVSPSQVLSRNFSKFDPESLLKIELLKLNREIERLKREHKRQIALKEREISRLKEEIERLKRKKEEEDVVVNPDGYRLLAVSSEGFVISKDKGSLFLARDSIFSFGRRLFKTKRLDVKSQLVEMEDILGSGKRVIFVRGEIRLPEKENLSQKEASKAPSEKKAKKPRPRKKGSYAKKK